MRRQQQEVSRWAILAAVVGVGLVGMLMVGPVAAQEAAPPLPTVGVEMVTGAQIEGEPFDPAAYVVDASVPVPILELPADGAVTSGVSAPPSGMPTLRWQPVVGAERYNVQISTSAGFATPLVNVNTYATAYVPTTTHADGLYYWRVRVSVKEGRSEVWSNFSAPWSYTKDWGAGGALAPVLVSPADDPGGVQPIAEFGAVYFQWEPVPGAASYELEVSTSPSFNVPNPYVVTTIKPFHTPTRHFSNSLYYWRVTPLDYRNNRGPTSVMRTFRFAWNHAPELITPESHIIARFVPTFSWTAVTGAKEYILEISTQNDFNSIQQTVRTAATSYTPETTLANNTDYFWRVRAVNWQNINGAQSEVRQFKAAWVQPPTLLSPPTNSIFHSYPYFSWTPVAGAEKYQIQIASGTGFDSPVVNKTLSNATAYTQPEWKTLIFNGDYRWRVRALDARGNTTEWSDERVFRMVTNPPPNLIYPEPYYMPDATGMPVHSERTVAHPVFVWDTSHEWLGTNGPAAFLYPDFYRLEVANELTFSNILLTIDSAGNAAAPTLAHPFNNLVDGSLYYWRVTPYRDGSPRAEGTVWTTRIDRGASLLPLATTMVPEPMYPAPGFIATGAPPVLGWLPVTNTHHYEVQIAQDQGFAAVVDSADALFVNYVPWQGRQTPMPPGLYWWRLRAKNADGAALGDWSAPRHFLVAQDLMTGNPFDYHAPTTKLKVTDPPNTLSLLNPPIPGHPQLSLYDPALNRVAVSEEVAAAPYDLGALHVLQDRSLSGGSTYANYDWAFAFGVNGGISGQVAYAVYVDVNQLPNVGGSSDPNGKSIGTDAFFRPEFVIYVVRTDDTLTGAWLYEWTGSGWNGPFGLAGLGGQFFYDAGMSAIQVQLPYARLTEASQQFSGALAVTVLSSGLAPTDPVQDTIPRQAILSLVDRPAIVSDMPMPLYPFDTPVSNPMIWHEKPSMRWRTPHYDSIDGYQVEVARNAEFTNEARVETWESFETNTNSLYGPIPAAFHSGNTYADDESYYWRVRFRHERYEALKSGNYDTGPWSPPMRFKLNSYSVGDPRTIPGDPVQATPTFAWERVEGASGYTIQVFRGSETTDANRVVDKSIDGNSFSPTDTLEDGVYSWRVAMRRARDVRGQWSPLMSFTKLSPIPTLTSPISPTVINVQPTFVWQAVLIQTPELQLAVPRYRLQWANNPGFAGATTVDTESTSYTPPKGQGLTDGTWYWRVAVIDADNRLGPYSEAQSFYKEYLPPTLISPVLTASVLETVMFEWTPLNGAAYYELEYANNDAFNRATRITTDNSRYIPTEKLSPSDYYWRVRMFDQDRKPGPFIPGRFSNNPTVNTGKIFIPIIRHVVVQ